LALESKPRTEINPPYFTTGKPGIKRKHIHLCHDSTQ